MYKYSVFVEAKISDLRPILEWQRSSLIQLAANGIVPTVREHIAQIDDAIKVADSNPDEALKIAGNLMVLYGR